MLFVWVSASAWADPPCYGWQLANHVEGEHVSVQWDELIDEADASRYAGVADAAWETYTGLGFPAPVGAPSVLFQEDPLGRGGFTDTIACENTYTARMFVYYDDAPGSDVTLAHELFHAVQYAYQPDADFIGNYYIWPWWAEGTATWATAANGDDPRAWSGELSSYLANGEIALHQDATAFLDPTRADHMYGTAVLAAHLGGETIDATFEAVRGRPGELAWFPDVITSIGVDWDELWQGYLAVLPTVALPIDTSLLDKPPRTSKTSALPAEGGADPERLPQGLGWAVHEFDPEAGPVGSVLWVEIEGDPAARWHAVLVRTAGKRVGSEVLEHVAIEVGADGRGEGRIPFDGEHPLFLVVSPEFDGEDGLSYTWRAEALLDEVAVGPACGCRATSPLPSAVGLLVLWVAARRRAGASVTAGVGRQRPDVWWRQTMGIEPTERSLSTRPDRF